MDKYCAQDGKKEAKIISLKFVLEGPGQEYTAIVEELKHGEFMLKVVLYQQNDKILLYPAKYDIVLLGRYVGVSIVKCMHAYMRPFSITALNVLWKRRVWHGFNINLFTGSMTLELLTRVAQLCFQLLSPSATRQLRLL